MLVNDLVKIWLEDVRQNHSKATHQSYSAHIKKFLRTFADRELDSIKPIELRQWINGCRTKSDGSPYAPDTIRCLVICVEAFQSFAVEAEVLPAKITKLAKPQTRLRERLPTEEEIALIFKFAPEDFQPIYKALRLTGARPSELCGAKIEQIDHSLDYRRIVIWEHKTAKKTGRPKIIPIGSKLGEIVDQEIGERTSGPIFLRKSGKPWNVDKLGRCFRDIRSRAGLPSDLIVYLTRHEVATKLCQQFSVAAARDALGHTNINTTNRYIKRDEQAMIKHQDLLDNTEQQRDKSAQSETNHTHEQEPNHATFLPSHRNHGA